MQLYAIYTSSHNPKVVGSNPSSATKFWGQNRCPSKNPGFSRVFFVFRRFLAFLKIEKYSELKDANRVFGVVEGI